MVVVMSIGNPKYRLFESTGFLYPEPFPAFGDSDDFDALASWAVDHNDWQGKSNAALIVSDEGTASGRCSQTVQSVKSVAQRNSLGGRRSRDTQRD